MQPEARKLLSDALAAANSIQSFVGHTSAEAYLLNAMMQAAVGYEFVIIGEALSQLRAIDLPTLGKISEYQRIIGFRNQVVHGYGKIDQRITWRIIETKLPVLKRELEHLLSQ